jgi:2-methylcitrate dehydratase PrpD
MSVTERIAAFVTSARYEDIPADVVNLAKRLILDTIGNAVGGFSTSGAKLALKALGRLGGVPQSTVLVTSAKTSPQLAAFANVSLACALDSDDSILNIGHISHCSFYPALALAERDGRSGRDLLAAFILAYEVGARVGRAGAAAVRKPDGTLFFGNTGVGSNWTIFPAAVGAARILGLSAAQTCSTMGIAGFTATIPTGRRWNKPHWNNLKYYPYPFAVQSAVTAALLAEAGYTGDPDIFDGDARDVKANWWTMAGFPGCNPESTATALGEEWVIRKAGFKPYPSCRFTHGPLDGFRKIIAGNEIDASELEKVDVYTARTLRVFQLHHPEVSGEEDCEFSMPHVIAMSALRVPVGPQWVASRYWNDPVVAAIRSKVECHVSEDANRAVIEQVVANDFVTFPYRVVVRARGERFEAAGEFAVGDHDTPETRYGDEEVIEKFRAFTEQGLAARSVQRCIDTVMSLDEHRDLRTLTDCFS